MPDASNQHGSSAHRSTSSDGARDVVHRRSAPTSLYAMAPRRAGGCSAQSSRQCGRSGRRSADARAFRRLGDSAAACASARCAQPVPHLQHAAACAEKLRWRRTTEVSKMKASLAPWSLRRMRLAGTADWSHVGVGKQPGAAPSRHGNVRMRRGQQAPSRAPAVPCLALLALRLRPCARCIARHSQ